MFIDIEIQVEHLVLQTAAVADAVNVRMSRERRVAARRLNYRLSDRTVNLHWAPNTVYRSASHDRSLG